MLRVVIGLFLISSTLGSGDFKNPNFSTGKYGIVHLFEWHWDTIADECESFLGPNKIGAVQISPPSENRVINSRPWWERYQPISYTLNTRSGDREALSNMVSRCNAVGVKIYADVVINHMCGSDGSGTGTGGTYFNANSEDFPGVPYSESHFNDANCQTSSGNIEDYQDPNQVRNCKLVSLVDLNQSIDYVRGKIIDFMNDLISLGVAGFRVDASKHMWPGDLDAIYAGLKTLEGGQKPYIYQEVIDQGGEPITASQYSGNAHVTEFKYGNYMAEKRFELQDLGNGYGSMLPSEDALVFINNHDNQRGHGGGGTIVYFDNPYDLKILTAYMMAYPYGTPRVMSSYYFSNSDEGPPEQQRSVNSDGTCGNGWVCEHRWRPITNMFEFAATVQGTSVENYWTNNDNRIAFSRGNKGFIAMSKNGYMNENLYTGLPDGSYCNIIEGDFKDGVCSGPCITVGNGYANIQISNNSDEEQVAAIHVNAVTTNCSA